MNPGLVLVDTCAWIDFFRNEAGMLGDRLEEITMATEPNRTARIEARIAPDALVVLKRAAELQGRSVADFVVAAASAAAHQVIEETQVIRLSTEDQQRCVELLLNPPPPAPALERAEKAHTELFGS